MAATAGGGPIMWRASACERDGGASLSSPPINHTEQGEKKKKKTRGER